MKKDDLRIIITSAIGVWILLIALGLSSAEAKDIDCNKHPIYCQIKKNSPKLNKQEAMELSNVVHKVSRKYRLPTRVFVGILAQESGYQLEAKGCHKGLVKQEVDTHTREPMTEKPEIYYKEVKVCADFGIGQIYYQTAESFNFDLHKLTTDLEYSVEAAAIVLADFHKRYSAREVDWWTRYNARSKIKRQIYKQLVERYF